MDVRVEEMEVVPGRAVLRVVVPGGEGECAPLASYDGTSVEQARAALVAYAREVRHFAADAPREAVLAACAAADPTPQFLAGMDLALWDRDARAAGVPVCALLADAPLARVPVNALGSGDPGARCVKLKLGDDPLSVRARLGPDVLLRVDANGAWAVEEAVREIWRMAAAGLEYVEEPVHGVEALRAVASRVGVPLAMDETDAPGAGVTEVVVVKVTRGGITGALAAAAAAREAGSDVVVASTMDGPVGIAAGLHVAAALRVTRHCGLATLPSVFPAVDGWIDVPSGPGLF